jgi:hypothetical protein
MVEYLCKDSILHIIYKDSIPSYINSIADSYEGKVPNRIGLNFPSHFLNIQNIKEIKNTKEIEKVKYVIVYKKGDKSTKEHELLHAKYYLEEGYKEKIKKVWNSMSPSSKKKVIFMLKKMGYPEDKEDILIDEFQAYYYTEKPNFFGKI